MIRALFYNTRNDQGVTLIEVMATIVILGMILPAVFTSFNTAIRESEAALTRLRCINVAQKAVESYKAMGYDGLMAKPIDGSTISRQLELGVPIEWHEANYAGTNICVTIKVTKTATPELIAMDVTATKGSTSAVLKTLLANNGL